MDVTSFLDQIYQDIASVGLDVSDMPLDHIAYQASSSQDYEDQKSAVTGVMSEHESVIGSRRVAVYGLSEPIIYKDHQIYAYEIIEPKADQVIESRLQHAEWVTPIDFKEFITNCPDIDWDTSSMERGEFAHLKLNFPDGLTLKFTHIPILEAIKDETLSVK